MKRLLTFFAIPVILFACNHTPTDEDHLSAEEWKKIPTYKKEEVIAMQKYYFDSVPKTNLNIIGVIAIDNPPLRRLLSDKDKFVLVVGAYLRDTLGKKKGDRAIMVGFKDKSKTNFYDFNTVFSTFSAAHSGGTVCPPPDPPCDVYDSAD